MAHFVDETGAAWSLHFTPESVQVSNLGWSFSTIDRQGRKPLVRRQGQQARTMTFTHTVGKLNPSDRDRGTTPTAAVNALMELADTGKKIRLINATVGIENRGWWYPQLQVTVQERTPAQQIKTAELTWTLTEAIDERPKIAKMPPPPPPKRATVPKTGQPDYTVKRGDSLWKIAAAKLGAGTRWRELYNLNQKRLNLKPPEMYRGLLTVWIFPGQRLKIPAR